MTHYSPEDQDLVNFIRQHHSVVPPASPDLELQILQQVKALSREPQPSKWGFWQIPSLVGAGFLVSLASYFIFVPRNYSTIELTCLDDFIQSNWQGAINQNFGNETWNVIESIND
jgi:hypothetical protein